MKQAFLIIAHDNFLLLQKLILALECPEVDFYVHIDAKVRTLPDLRVGGDSSLTVIQDRVDTRWGDYSQITTELKLLEEAYSKDRYSYYHIISGTHYPLKPIEEVLSFFEGMNGKTIFSELCQSSLYQETMKLRHYNLFTRRLAYGSARSRVAFQRLWRVSHRIQDFFKIRRNEGIEYYKASNWVSLSEEAVEYLLNKEVEIRKVFRWSFCGDEFFVPTMLKSSHLEKYMVSSDKLLKQQMGDANPKVYTMEDFDNLVESGCMFARKFSENNMDVVDRISDYIR